MVGRSKVNDVSGWESAGRKRQWFVAGAVLAACWALPTAAVAAGDAFVCAELKAAVADAEGGFAAHKGALKAPSNAAQTAGKTYLTSQSMKGARTCSVVEASLDEPKLRLRQTAYICQFPAVLKLDQRLRDELTRCVAGEVDEPSDPDEFTLWVDRVSSGEGYRATEVNALANPVTGLTLQVRQSVCTNKGNGQACEE